jgi:hypothetical protein
LEAAVFPPSLSRLVGQGLDRLARSYDRLQVMLYHKCSGPACHNHEHAALQKLLEHLGLPVHETLERLGIEQLPDAERLEHEGTPADAIARELREALRQAGGKATPILWLDSRLGEIVESIGSLADSIILFAPGNP